MPLILTITQTRGGGDRQIRTLGQGTLSIGRAPGNDWVLADPDQHLSRTHCMVAFEAGRYVLTDLSTNGMLVNGAREPTTRNSRLVLTDGDTVQFGSYTLAVAEADGAAGGVSGSPFGAGSFLSPRADPFAASEGPGGSFGDGGPLDIDPLDDPLGPPGGGHGAAGFQHPLPHSPPALRPADPFDVAEAQRRPRETSLGVSSLDEDLFHGAEPVEPWKGPAQQDRLDPRSQAYTAPRNIVQAPPASGAIDFDDLIGDIMPVAAPHPLAPQTPAATPSPGMGSGDDIDDLLGDFVPAPGPTAAPAPARPQPGTAPLPQPQPPAAIATPPIATPPAVAPAAIVPPTPVPAAAPSVAAAVAGTPQNGATSAALLAAFAEAAGIPQLDLGSADPQAAMRAIGTLFAAFVTGTREVLMSRAEIKHEMRVEQTMMRPRDNNALKFSVSTAEALAALLQPGRPGYKPPLAAVEEAFNDIRSHEMAVMAGLQTALIALLKRFDPAALEGRLQRGMLDAVLPAARKARFWELFCATYKDIASEAQDDFHSIFGSEFARAYDAQIRKL